MPDNSHFNKFWDELMGWTAEQTDIYDSATDRAEYCSQLAKELGDRITAVRRLIEAQGLTEPQTEKLSETLLSLQMFRTMILNQMTIINLLLRRGDDDSNRPTLA